MGANLQSAAPCQSHLNLSEGGEEAIAQWTYSGPQALLGLVSRSIILCVGLLGNGAFLVVVAKVRRMHTVVNVYLAHLAVADVIVLLQHTAVPLVNDLVLGIPSSGHWLGAPGCMVTMFFKYFGYFTSIILVCLVSAERFLSVCRPLRHRSVNTKGRAAKLVAFAWLLAGGFSACAVPTSTLHTKVCISWPRADRFSGYPPYAGRCAPSAQWVVHAFDVIQAVPFFVALVCNAVFFTRIVHNLRRREKAERTGGSAYGSRRGLAGVTHQVTLMLAATSAVFFVCNAPFQSLSLCLLVAALAGWRLFASPSTLAVVLTVFRILVYVNSAVNPVVYNATNARYRDAFVEVFGCSCSMSPRPAPVASGGTSSKSRSVKNPGLL